MAQQQRIISRGDAVAQGLKRYYTGTPCKSGHDCERLASNYSCIQCSKANLKQWSSTGIGKARISESNKKRYADPEIKEKIKSANAKWQRENPEKVAEKSRRHHVANADRIRELQKIGRIANREERLARYRNDPHYRMTVLMRTRIGKLIKRGDKAARTTALLGCDRDTFVAHIEKSFKPGMTWDNWSLHGWHVDHIRPLISFDLADPEQQKSAFHYTNLQPLWAVENMIKGGRYEV